MKRGATAGLVVLLVAACQQLTTEPGGSLSLQVQTEGSAFARDPGLGSAEVQFAVENRGTDTLYMARCGERVMAALDRRQGGQWVQHSGDACQAVNAMDPAPLPPGGVLSSTHQVLEAGRYRLRPGVGARPALPTTWTAAASNEFTVE